MKLIVNYKHDGFFMGSFSLFCGAVGIVYLLTNIFAESFVAITISVMGLFFFGFLFLDGCFEIQSGTVDDSGGIKI